MSSVKLMILPVLKHVPLLQIQKNWFKTPPGMERFQDYLKTIMTPDQKDLGFPPLGQFNPMSKEHVERMVDELIKIDAEKILEDVLQYINRVLSVDRDWNVGLVVVDDLKGGWTCRETVELSGLTEKQGGHKRGWFSMVWWVSENPKPETFRQKALMQIYKNLKIMGHGQFKSLAQIVKLETEALQFAGIKSNGVFPEWKNQFEKYWEATDTPTLIACLYGDVTAQKLGYDSLGFPANAGSIYARSLAR